MWNWLKVGFGIGFGYVFGCALGSYAAAKVTKFIDDKTTPPQQNVGF
jgi:hypothetical protein